MMYEMRMKKPEPTLLPTKGIFNLQWIAAQLDKLLQWLGLIPLTPVSVTPRSNQLS